MEGTKSSVPITRTEKQANMEDMCLVAALLHKDRKATAEFINRYSDPLYSYLQRRLIPRADLVEDVLQEVFLAAWENLHNFQGRSSLKSWLLGIARHKIEDYYRSKLREPEPIEEESAMMATPELILDEIIDRQRLQKKAREVLESLPENYSIALLWRYWEERSALYMAEQTGRTVKAVERLLSRARTEFKRRWKS
ncbi:MAG: sigma-70 family RNA polymerase sigma factor [Acidobacteriota bacterium]